jgi:hypothetical protein
MSVLGWLAEGAYVNRHVNMLYFIVVCSISVGVLATAVRMNDRRAMRMYLYSMPVWAAIEGIGLASGMRIYGSHQFAVFFFVALIEDPGWVTLAFMASESLFKRLYGPPPPG